MNVVMDVDGTVIDTREQVREAYARVGVIQPPETFHQPWEQWLPRLTGGIFQAARIHKRKNQVYPKVLEEIPPKLLPAARLLELRVKHGRPTYLVTSGSEEGITLALEVAGLAYVPVLGFGLNAEEKNLLLETEFDKPGVYVDDNRDFKLTASGWQFIHYYGQSLITLNDQLLMIAPDFWEEKE